MHLPPRVLLDANYYIMLAAERRVLYGTEGGAVRLGLWDPRQVHGVIKSELHCTSIAPAVTGSQSNHPSLASGSSMYKNEAKSRENGGDTAPRQAKLMNELTGQKTLNCLSLDSQLSLDSRFITRIIGKLWVFAGLCDRDLPLNLSSTAFLRADEKHMAKTPATNSPS